MKLYAVREKSTGKLVRGFSNPSRKFWERKADCENAVKRKDKKERMFGFDSSNFEVVAFELVEVTEDKDVQG